MLGEISNDSDTPTNSTMPLTPIKKNLLEKLETEEQRRVLDTVARVRKCGLEGTLSLPQIVVCGDQSSGKSSVLEALTEIPFPRNDNLCTRYATEISLRNASSDSITIRVIPDIERPISEQTDIKRFERSIMNFDDLPNIMNDAMEVMGIGGDNPRAFARDVLSIVYSGPDRPQLTLVDIPGLIGAKTKATTTEDIGLVAEITQHYIKQPRTICLAVVSATTDYANQTILERVREVDPTGARTLGVITKPDAVEAGSGHEKSYIELAQNNDIYFDLGWHVVKNRKFEERNFTLAERKESEDRFFRTTNWNSLPSDSIGIDTLRSKLSVLLFEHVKKELPSLREELEKTLSNTQNDLEQLGCPRSSSADCHKYLTQLSLELWKTCKSAVDGHYEGSYFHQDIDHDFNLSSDSTIRRARAVVQVMNSNFADDLRLNGQKFRFEKKEIRAPSSEDEVEECHSDCAPSSTKSWPPADPKKLSRKEGLEWVRKALVFNRGKELVGNFNPLIVGELFFELSEKWGDMATSHLDAVANVCMRFLKALLQNKCPEDVERKIWMIVFEEELQSRRNAATDELKQLMQDLKQYPINYNHYYTDTIAKRRQDRQKEQLTKHIKAATTNSENFISNRNVWENVTEVDVDAAIAKYSQNTDPNMDNFSCEEALDCLFAIYKVSQKTFVANVTTQVIERHIIRGLEEIFSPMYVAGLKSEEAEALASEPLATKRKREYLMEQIKKLEEGRQIFRSVL